MNEYDQPYAGDISTSLTLLERAGKQDQDAWSRIQELYVPLVYQWCRMKRVPPSDIPDVGQEVFIAVVSSLENFERTEEGQSFRGWLRTITRNKIADFYRGKGIVMDAQGGSTAQLMMNEAAFNTGVPEDEPTNQQELELLWNKAYELVLTEFPEWYADVFIRLVANEEKAADIAEDLGKQASAIFNIKSRILRRLRKEFGDLLD